MINSNAFTAVAARFLSPNRAKPDAVEIFGVDKSILFNARLSQDERKMAYQVGGTKGVTPVRPTKVQRTVRREAPSVFDVVRAKRIEANAGRPQHKRLTTNPKKIRRQVRRDMKAAGLWSEAA